MRHLALATIITAGAFTPAPARAITLSESVRLRTAGPCHEAVDAIMPANVRTTFHRIVNRESGGRQWAAHHNRNGSTDHSCLMINSIWLSPKAKPRTTMACITSARCNVAFALRLYEKYGLTPWRATA